MKAPAEGAKAAPDGCATGSWAAVGPLAAKGTLAATALNVLTLEVYYRYGRMTRK
jgi:hypothetical protein